MGGSFLTSIYIRDLEELQREAMGFSGEREHKKEPPIQPLDTGHIFYLVSFEM
jgi:hypothetical protein